MTEMRIPVQGGPIGRDPALLVIDAQNDFTEEEAPVACRFCSEGVEDTEEALENINRVVEAAREADIPIIWSYESHRPDYSDYGSELLSVELKHTMEGSRGWDLRDELDVDVEDLNPAEYVVEKRRYNLFHRTGLEHLFATYGVDSVIVVGFATNVCVHYTSHGAHERDYAYRVVRQATAGTSQEMHDNALEFLDYLQPGGVQDIDAVLDALEDYDGNEVVKRVKKTGSVYPEEATEGK